VIQARKRVVGCLVSVVVLAAALTGAASAQAVELAAPTAASAPALASEGRSPLKVSPLSAGQCEYGYYCAWQNRNWEGTFWFWGNPKNEWFYVGAGANDQISSDWNRHQNATYVSKDWPAGTYQFCITAGGSHESYESNYPQPPYPNVNDTISALYLKTSGC
jgi:Peptidase inhibitor family I36